MGMIKDKNKKDLIVAEEIKEDAAKIHRTINNRS